MKRMTFQLPVYAVLQEGEDIPHLPSPVTRFLTLEGQSVCELTWPVRLEALRIVDTVTEEQNELIFDESFNTRISAILIVHNYQSFVFKECTVEKLELQTSGNVDLTYLNTNIVSLKIYNSPLTGKGSWLSKTLEWLNPREISIQTCGLQQQDVQDMTSYLQQHQNSLSAERLYLNSTDFSGDAEDTVMLLENLPNLKKIDWNIANSQIYNLLHKSQDVPLAEMALSDPVTIESAIKRTTLQLPVYVVLQEGEDIPHLPSPVTRFLTIEGQSVCELTWPVHLEALRIVDTVTEEQDELIFDESYNTRTSAILFVHNDQNFVFKECTVEKLELQTSGNIDITHLNRKLVSLKIDNSQLAGKGIWLAKTLAWLDPKEISIQKFGLWQQDVPDMTVSNAGEDIVKLPEQMPHLQIIGLQANAMAVVDVDDMTRYLQEQQISLRAESLYLRNNNLPRALPYIFKLLEHIPSLLIIDLGESGLCGTDVCDISTYLENHQGSLVDRTLSLCNNNTGGDMFKLLKYIPPLSGVILGNNHLSHNDKDAVTDYIQCQGNIMKIHFDYELISDSSVDADETLFFNQNTCATDEYIVRMLAYVSSLKVIRFADNYLSRAKIKTINKYLQEHQILLPAKGIHFNKSDMSGAGKDIIQLLLYMPKLKMINMGENNLSGEDLQHMASYLLEKNCSLPAECIYLAKNNLAGGGESIIQLLLQMPKLKIINMGENHLSGDDLQHMTSYLLENDSSLPAESLFLTKNNLSHAGEANVKLLEYMPSLRKVYLGDNHFCTLDKYAILVYAQGQNDIFTIELDDEVDTGWNDVIRDSNKNEKSNAKKTGINNTALASRSNEATADKICFNKDTVYHTEQGISMHLKQIPSFKSIHFEDDYLSSETLKNINSYLDEHNILLPVTSINFSKNNMLGLGKDITKLLLHMPKLKIISLIENNLSKEDIQDMASCLQDQNFFSLPAESLFLSDNNLLVRAEDITKLFDYLPRLRKIDLRGSHLCEEDKVKIMTYVQGQNDIFVVDLDEEFDVIRNNQDRDSNTNEHGDTCNIRTKQTDSATVTTTSVPSFPSSSLPSSAARPPRIRRRKNKCSLS